jgi:hypothetical protein
MGLGLVGRNSKQRLGSRVMMQRGREIEDLLVEERAVHVGFDGASGTTAGVSQNAARPI